MVKNNNPRLRVRTVTTHAAGPVAYDAAARPTLNYTGVRHVETLDDIQMWANGGYLVRPTVIAPLTQTITYMVLSLNRAAAVGALAVHAKAAVAASIDDHAAHQHDISLANGAAFASTVKENAGALGSTGGAVKCVNAADAAAVSAHAGAADLAHAAAAAALKDVPAAEEVLNGTDVSGVTVYARVTGYY